MEKLWFGRILTFLRKYDFFNNFYFNKNNMPIFWKGMLWKKFWPFGKFLHLLICLENLISLEKTCFNLKIFFRNLVLFTYFGNLTSKIYIYIYVFRNYFGTMKKRFSTILEIVNEFYFNLKSWFVQKILHYFENFEGFWTFDIFLFYIFIQSSLKID